jgi:NitT/TauT family transport system ATP-binding protein
MDWGRYAELFSDDEPSGEIFIEESTTETEESE